MSALPLNVEESVKIAQEIPSTSSTASEDGLIGGWLRRWLGAHTGWIRNNWNWSKIKPVMRCALVGWISVVLFVIPRVEIFLGQASFLILIAAFLSPPSDPFVSVLERETLILLFVAIAWAWACLGMFLANLTRRVHNPSATFLDVINGQFIEAAPTVILGIFIFFGSASILYIKARQGPGPYLFACIFACLCLDISLTTSVLFPLPFFRIGQSIILPITFHSALALLGSIFIFPSTISAQFTTRVQDVLTPVISAIDLHRTILSAPFPIDSDSSSTSMDMIKYTENVNAASAFIKGSEAALGPLAASARLMKSDLIYNRFAPHDFKAFQKLLRRMSGRINGLATFFSILGVGSGSGAGPGMGADRSGMMDTPAHTVPNSPGNRTPITSLSRRPSLEKIEDDEGKPRTPTIPSIPHSIRSHSKAPSSSLATHKHSHSHPHLLHTSLLTLSRSSQWTLYDKPSRGYETEHAVGTFESQRYLNLEATRLWDPNREEWTRQAMQVLGESCDPVLEVCRDGLTAVNAWLGGVRTGRITYWLGIRRKERDQEIAAKIVQMKELRDKIGGVLESFRNGGRLRVLDPYRPIFGSSNFQSRNFKAGVQDSNDEHDLHERYGTDEEYQIPPHRYLFYSYFYQYHLIQVCSIIIEMFDEIIKLEEERTHDRLWTPVGNIFKWNKALFPENADQTEDDDPDVIQGLQHDPDDENDSTTSEDDDLGIPRKRDPDALPPRNSTEWVMTLVHTFIMGLGGGNTLFALKAGLLTVLLCLPSFFKSSARFAYENRFVWGVFMGQLTIARFRGDTAFGLVARIGSTFFGGLTGLVMWYISSGSAKGNAFGIAAVCGVCFPFFFFARLYAPIPPMTNIVYFVTAGLVIGYSYQGTHILSPGSPGFGWAIAWRRFVLVTVGVVGAFLFSWLPPSTTIRRYHRNLLSTTSSQLGVVYCTIISFASTKEEQEIQEIISSLLAVRAKLNRSVTLRENITYEFSLRGRWPKERYQKIVDLQIAISYSLSNLISVLEHLEPSWARAFLKRTRFMDPDFQGDVLAVISMISSSLRTGYPLPQITPCPLLDRFLLQYHGFNIIHKEAGEDYGLPRSMTLDTLKNEQYLMFCVGITTSFGFINRLDQLMLATKEVVGEHYHIHGVGGGVGGASATPILKEGIRPITSHFRPPSGVPIV